MEHQGDFYNKTNSWQSDRWEELLDLLKTTSVDFQKVRQVLDIGCGSGKLTAALADVFPNVDAIVGTDISITMLDTARRENSGAKIQYRELKAEKTGDLNSRFDVVFSNFVLHWVEDKDSVFRELDQIIAPDGFLVLGTCQDLPQILWDVDAALRRELNIADKVKAPFHYLDLMGWTELLKKHGWKVVAASAKRDSHYVSEAEEYLLHWVTASTQKICYGHFFDDLTHIQKQSLLNEILAKYRYKDDNELLFHEDTLLLIAQKIS